MRGKGYIMSVTLLARDVAVLTSVLFNIITSPHTVKTDRWARQGRDRGAEVSFATPGLANLTLRQFFLLEHTELILSRPESVAHTCLAGFSEVS